MLDSDVWAALQKAAEKRYFMKRCQTDALVRTVIGIWLNGFLDEIIAKGKFNERDAATLMK